MTGIEYLVHECRIVPQPYTWKCGDSEPVLSCLSTSWEWQCLHKEILLRNKCANLGWCRAGCHVGLQQNFAALSVWPSLISTCCEIISSPFTPLCTIWGPYCTIYSFYVHSIHYAVWTNVMQLRGYKDMSKNTEIECVRSRVLHLQRQ
jgi:hypothetical protein